MSVLTSDQLGETHPMLPDGWRRSMTRIRRDGGPWSCLACGGPSYLPYRCSACGHNLIKSGGSAGRLGVER